ncbi:hypothetical protein GIB67_028983 [Kingdonia uniflora]|uniref:DUF7903 domain-containing protein n=1 Tax=Kingdonia uniflora TaxID=39325 RepID=A0A7J7LC07_9MAGN|nr:hypothetical protein GIB67_028983 [Kingdonia uniflora]
MPVGLFSLKELVLVILSKKSPSTAINTITKNSGVEAALDQDDDMHSLRKLIKSAIIDPEVEGGLRWPFGNESLGERYSVFGVCHTTKVRHADRFDFRTSFREVSGEVSLNMIGITRQIEDRSLEPSLVMFMLRDNLKVIWDNFL